MDKNALMSILLNVPALVIAVSFHEAAHAWAADRLGDGTARMLGRVSLNPIRHIDPIGSIIIPLFLAVSGSGFMFGWAKPVPVYLHNLGNPKRDNALIAAAGPGSNLLMAFAAAVLMRPVTWAPDALDFFAKPLLYLLFAIVMVNVILAVFNLIPIPPLDGGSVITAFLSDELAEKFLSIRSFGMLIILLLFFMDPLNLGLWSKFIHPIVQALTRFFLMIGGVA